MDKLTAEIIVWNGNGREIGHGIAAESETLETAQGEIIHEFLIHLIIKEKGGKYEL